MVRLWAFILKIRAVVRRVRNVFFMGLIKVLVKSPLNLRRNNLKMNLFWRVQCANDFRQILIFPKNYVSYGNEEMLIKFEEETEKPLKNMGIVEQFKIQSHWASTILSCSQRYKRSRFFKIWHRKIIYGKNINPQRAFCYC